MTRQPMPFDVTPFHWLLHLSLRLDDVYWTSGNAVKSCWRVGAIWRRTTTAKC
jgi:hypothetical protein